ncbi:ribosomal RNA processing protein 36 homolog [Panulirus ornatus]|uniref:ribosomal RNA processing protein 36 homolog n=1 Tax=Panulirus ornatus TaxID=150431 RepID=UPI003A83B93D
MSSPSSRNFNEDFAEKPSSGLSGTSFAWEMNAHNKQRFFPSEYQSDSSSETDSDESRDGEIPEQDDEDQDPYSKMSMKQLLKLQEDMGVKKFKQEVLKGSGHPSSDPTETRQTEKQEQFKRANKNRPSEVPMMRKAAPRLFSLPRHNVKKKITRDPRFDNLSGHLNMTIWKGNYRFLKDQRKKEKEILKEEMKSVSNPIKKKKMRSIIQRMENQEKEQAKHEKGMEIRKGVRHRQMDSLRQGKKPKFMTKREQKILLKAAQYEELKKTNRVEKYLERKEKRKLAKEMKNRGKI